MRKSTAHIVEYLLQLLLPAPGRHRVATPRPIAECQDELTMRIPRVPALDQARLNGAEIRIVRPYVLAHEQAR